MLAHPLVEVVFCSREAANTEILEIFLVDRDALPLLEVRGASGRAHRNIAHQHLYRRAILECVHAKFGALGNRDIESNCLDAERILAGEVGIKISGALGQGEVGRAASAGKVQLCKLQNGIFSQKCRCAVLKLNGGAAILRREGVAFHQGQIGRRLFPNVSAGVRDEHLPFGETQADNPDGILSVRHGSQKNGKPYRCEKSRSHE